MTPATEILAAPAVSAMACPDCRGQGWLYLEPDDAEVDAKSPCPTCRPYGMRVGAESELHKKGDRVEHIYSHRTGVVLRFWRRSQGSKRPEPYVMADVRYDDGMPGIAWEQDLVKYEAPKDVVPFDPDEAEEYLDG